MFFFNRNAVASFASKIGTGGATALRLFNPLRIPRVAEAATLGWREQPLCG
jgi:hypothetical protein